MENWNKNFVKGLRNKIKSNLSIKKNLDLYWFSMLYSSMKLRNKKMVLKQDIKDGVLKFMEHLNNTMDKPDGYEYHLNTRGSKYFKVEMTSRGMSRSVYCFIEKSTGIILKSAGWRAPAKGPRGSVLIVDSYKHSDWSGGWLYKVFGNVYGMIG